MTITAHRPLETDPNLEAADDDGSDAGVALVADAVAPDGRTLRRWTFTARSETFPAWAWR